MLQNEGQFILQASVISIEVRARSDAWRFLYQLWLGVQFISHEGLGFTNRKTLKIG